MSGFQDAEAIIERITKTESVSESAGTLLEWIIFGLQRALNAPDQHAQLQHAVNTLTAKKDELAAAVEAEPPTAQPSRATQSRAGQGSAP